MPDPSPREGTADAPTEAAWRVDRRLTVAKWAGAAIFALAAVIGFRDPGQLIVVGIAAGLLVVLGIRDLIAPVRLAAGPEGVTVVSGLRSRRTIPWSQVQHIKVDARRGMLLRSQVLELDVDDQLYFFSVSELGAPCEDVAETLMAIRSRSEP